VGAVPPQHRPTGRPSAGGADLLSGIEPTPRAQARPEGFGPVVAGKRHTAAARVSRCSADQRSGRVERHGSPGLHHAARGADAMAAQQKTSRLTIRYGYRRHDLDDRLRPAAACRFRRRQWFELLPLGRAHGLGPVNGTVRAAVGVPGLGRCVPSRSVPLAANSRQGRSPPPARVERPLHRRRPGAGAPAPVSGPSARPMESTTGNVRDEQTATTSFAVASRTSRSVMAKP